MNREDSAANVRIILGTNLKSSISIRLESLGYRGQLGVV
jgi:hypothetical protein